MICKICKSKMGKGIAINPYEDFGRLIVALPPINYDSMELHQVDKCHECGHTEMPSHDRLAYKISNKKTYLVESI